MFSWCGRMRRRQQVEALTQQFKTVIEERGGKVTKNEYWGVKPLTYRIRRTARRIIP